MSSSLKNSFKLVLRGGIIIRIPKTSFLVDMNTWNWSFSQLFFCWHESASPYRTTWWESLRYCRWQCFSAFVFKARRFLYTFCSWKCRPRSGQHTFHSCVLKRFSGFFNGDFVKFRCLKLIENHCKAIITVDCGTSSFAPIDYAKNFGIDVIVLDHHQSEVNNRFNITKYKW